MLASARSIISLVTRSFAGSCAGACASRPASERSIVVAAGSTLNRVRRFRWESGIYARYHNTVTVKEPTRERLVALRNGLLKLHKVLLDSEREIYEHDIARINSASQFLGLVLEDPHFAWLRELSQLVVLIDETLEWEEPATMIDADRLVVQSRALISPSEQGTGFARSYYEAMQRDPNVVMAHSDMLKVFAGI